MKQPQWPIEEVELLKKHYPLLGPEAISEFLPNYSKQAIINKVHRLNIRKKNIYKPITEKKWKNMDLSTLIEGYYKEESIQKIADSLNRPLRTITDMAYTLKLSQIFNKKRGRPLIYRTKVVHKKIFVKGKQITKIIKSKPTIKKVIIKDDEKAIIQKQRSGVFVLGGE